MASISTDNPGSWLRPGERVFVGAASNEPLGLLDALRPGVPTGVEFIQFPLRGLNGTDFTAWGPSVRQTTVFMTPALGKADPQRLAFLPLGMRAFYDYLRTDIDVALIQVAMDAQGNLRSGPNVDFLTALLNSRARIYAERVTGATAPVGAPLVSPNRLAGVFESPREFLPLDLPLIDDTAAAIAAQVAEVIQDGDCLQTGVGAIPAAILQALDQHNDLGWHGGLVDDAVLRLIERGNVNGLQKSIDPGVHVAGMALCSTAGYDRLAELASLSFRSADYTHSYEVLRTIDRFVSINGALEVDLSGQINAEVAGGRQLAGTGGAVDFMRGARASAGGRSIVALPATARGGSVSRIVPQVEHVTALRTDVDLVATEYGVADLRHASLAERRERLRAIAAPVFRDQL
ncbi:MAG: acetyl-CoA hydrolase/transferase C-terminal domain-containing protein [Pseudomonadota bacterium]